MLAENPALRGLMCRTDPNNQFRDDFEDNEIESDIETLINNRTSERLVTQVYLYKSADVSELKKFIVGIKDKGERDRILDRVKLNTQIIKFPNKSLWHKMYGAGPEIAAKDFYDMFRKLSLERKDELVKELGKVNQVRKITTPAFKEAYKKEVLKNK